MHVPCSLTWAYVLPQYDCDAEINQAQVCENLRKEGEDHVCYPRETKEACDPTSFNLYTRNTGGDRPNEERCNQDTGCPASSRPIGVRSKNYFNVGLAVGDGGVIVRTLDGGYSWQCLRKCGLNDIEPGVRLSSISTNVHTGGVGYDHAYYSPQGTKEVGDVTWDQLELEGENMGQGLDGVYWNPNTYAQAG